MKCICTYYDGLEFSQESIVTANMKMAQFEVFINEESKGSKGPKLGETQTMGKPLSSSYVPVKYAFQQE